MQLKHVNGDEKTELTLLLKENSIQPITVGSIEKQDNCSWCKSEILLNEILNMSGKLCFALT